MNRSELRTDFKKSSISEMRNYLEYKQLPFGSVIGGVTKSRAKYTHLLRACVEKQARNQELTDGKIALILPVQPKTNKRTVSNKLPTLSERYEKFNEIDLVNSISHLYFYHFLSDSTHLPDDVEYITVSSLRAIETIAVANKRGLGRSEITDFTMPVERKNVGARQNKSDLAIFYKNLSDHISPLILKIATSLMVSIQSWNIMVVYPGAEDQDWHTDVPGKRKYFTVIVPLTRDNNKSGGTEIKVSKNGDSNVVIRAKPHEVYVFSGQVWHRGLANNSNSSRIFLYAALSNAPDENV